MINESLSTTPKNKIENYSHNDKSNHFNFKSVGRIVKLIFE